MLSESLVYLARPQSRGCKRKHDSVFQDATPPPSAFAGRSTQAFDTHPHPHGCAANRSASVDSEASSYSPLPKRHCLYPCQVPNTPDYWQHQQDSVPQQQHASVQPSTLSDAQKLYALESQHAAGQQAGAVVAYLHQLQRLRHAAAAQARRHQQHASEHSSTLAQARCALRAREQHHHQALLQQHHVISRLAHRQSGALPIDHSCTQLDSFMHQLLDVQTPTQHQESHSSTVPYCPTEAYWQHHRTAEPTSAAYDSAQVHATAYDEHHSGCSQHYHQLSRNEQMWQSLLRSAQGSHSASDPHSRNSPAVNPPAHLLHVQQHARMLQQLAQAKHACIQQHLAQEQQAYAQRQLTVSATSRPALGFSDLVTYWAQGLSLQRMESVHLACHLWSRVQHQVSIAYMHLLGAEKPWETMLLGCLWLAAKLEECRRGVPTASKVGAMVGVDKGVVGGVELYLMQLVNWAPLVNWKDRPLQNEDDSWC